MEEFSCTDSRCPACFRPTCLPTCLPASCTTQAPAGAGYAGASRQKRQACSSRPGFVSPFVQKAIDNVNGQQGEESPFSERVMALLAGGGGESAYQGRCVWESAVMLDNWHLWHEKWCVCYSLHLGQHFCWHF